VFNLFFLDAEGKMEDSELNCSKHIQNLFSFQFLLFVRGILMYLIFTTFLDNMLAVCLF